MRLTVRTVRSALREPFVSSQNSIQARELVLLSLTDSDGESGWGESAPLAASAAEVRAALEDCRPILEAWAEPPAPGPGFAEVLAHCAAAAVLPEALCAIDMALWDLVGRRMSEPVWRLLGATEPQPLHVNATVATPDRAGAASAVATALKDGFDTVKVKVGLGDDAGRIAAVRAAAGRSTAIRLDANGAWSGDEALAALRSLEPAGIELCEEPCTGLDLIEQVAGASSVPIALDESAGQPGALDRRVCAAVCLKLGRCGGLSGLLHAADAARAAGYEVYLASSLDGPLGIAAALHAAARVRPNRASGLATLGWFEQGFSGLGVKSGRMAVPPGSGLGEGLRSWYG